MKSNSLLYSNIFDTAGMLLFIYMLLPASLICQSNQERTLLIGDSHFYWTRVDSFLQLMIDSNDKNMYINMSAYGGFSLRSHLDEKNNLIVQDTINEIPYKVNPTIKFLKKTSWDYIILEAETDLRKGKIYENFIAQLINLQKYSKNKHYKVIVSIPNFSINYPKYICDYDEKLEKLSCINLLSFQQNVDTLLSRYEGTRLSKFIYEFLLINYLSEKFPNISLFDDENGHPSHILSFFIAYLMYVSIFNSDIDALKLYNMQSHPSIDQNQFINIYNDIKSNGYFQN